MNTTIDIAKSIKEKLDAGIEATIRIPKSAFSNWVSQLGHPCLRYLVYRRKNGEEGQRISIEKAKLFEAGEFYELLARKRFERAGYRLLENQEYVTDKATKVVGKIDFMLETEDGNRYPLEVKGISEWDYDKLNTIEDFYKSDKHYIRSYPAQLNLYLYLKERELGFFYLINKKTLQDKLIPVILDYEYTETLLKKAEEINKYADGEGYPDRIEWDEFTCGECEFKHICLPEAVREGKVDIKEDTALEEMLNRRAELEPLKKEYDKLDNDIKEIGKVMEKDNTIIGNWIITRSVSKGVRKPSPGGEYTITKISIKRLTEERG